MSPAELQRSKGLVKTNKNPVGIRARWKDVPEDSLHAVGMEELRSFVSEKRNTIEIRFTLPLYFFAGEISPAKRPSSEVQFKNNYNPVGI